MRPRPERPARPADRRLLPTLLALLLAALLAAPAAAYVVVLKDGSTLLAAEPYRIEDGRALIVLENGTTTFIDPDEIDGEATADANRRQLGSALVLEDGEVRNMADAPPPEPTHQTLSDLIERGAAQPRERAQARRPGARQPAGPAAPERPAAEGWDQLERATHPDLELAAELRRPFLATGIEEVQVLSGPAPDLPRLELVAGSESAVFRALRTAAEVLTRLEAPAASKVAGFDLVMRTPEGERAGRFRLTPDLARELTAEGMEVSRFFVEHVRF